jgi:hypothetical protein
LLHQRDQIPADHPDHTVLRDPTAPGPGDPDSIVDAWPLRDTDPVWVDGTGWCPGSGPAGWRTCSTPSRPPAGRSR